MQPEPIVNVWIDAQLPPALAAFLAASFAVHASHVQDLGLIAATDSDIFRKARAAMVVVVTKDRDFIRLLEVHGPPPQVLWVTTGNIRNADLFQLLALHWKKIEALFQSGEQLVEIGGGS